jgi:hypothetical protein
LGKTPAFSSFARYSVLNLPVDDVTAVVRELTDRGVTMERYDAFEQDDLGINHVSGARTGASSSETTPMPTSRDRPVRQPTS